MPESKMCPKCGAKMEEKKYRVRYGPSKDTKYPPEQWIYKYYCPKCKKEFLEDDLS